MLRYPSKFPRWITIRCQWFGWIFQQLFFSYPWQGVFWYLEFESEKNCWLSFFFECNHAIGHVLMTLNRKTLLWCTCLRITGPTLCYTCDKQATFFRPHITSVFSAIPVVLLQKSLFLVRFRLMSLVWSFRFKKIRFRRFCRLLSDRSPWTFYRKIVS